MQHTADRTQKFETEALAHSRDLYRAAMRLLRDAGKAGDVVRHERRSWFKWLTGREEDVAGANIVAAEPVASSLADQDILAALDSLPIQFREVVLLVDVEELSYKEASQALSIPIGTVMSRLNRGRGLLRQQLANTASSDGLRKGRSIQA